MVINSTMVGDALECFRTAFPLEMYIEICHVNKLISGNNEIIAFQSSELSVSTCLANTKRAHRCTI